MKSLAYTRAVQLWEFLIGVVVFGGMLALGIVAKHIGFIISSSIVLAFVLVSTFILDFLRKYVAVSCDEEGIILHKTFRTVKVRWNEICSINFFRYHNRYFSVSYGKIKIGLPQNKEVKISNISDVKVAYDRIVAAKREHFEEIKKNMEESYNL